MYVGLEQGPNSFIYRRCAPRASRNQSDLFIEKGEILIFLLLLLGNGSALKLTIRRGSGGSARARRRRVNRLQWFDDDGDRNGAAFRTVVLHSTRGGQDVLPRVASPV
jgi:hypothetical protein